MPDGALRPLDRPLEHDPDQVRRAAEDLLSRPPYAAEPAGPVGRIVEVVRDWLAGVLDALLAAAGATPAVAWAIVAVAVALLALVAWRLVRTLSPDRRLASSEEPTQRRTAAELRQEGEDAAAAGDLDRAVLTLYHALVTGLGEAGLLDDVAGRTIRELDDEVSRTAPEAATRVAAAGRAVDRVLYAGDAATGEDVEVVRRALAAVGDGATGRWPVAALTGRDR